MFEQNYANEHTGNYFEAKRQYVYLYPSLVAGLPKYTVLHRLVFSVEVKNSRILNKFLLVDGVRSGPKQNAWRAQLVHAASVRFSVATLTIPQIV